MDQKKSKLSLSSTIGESSGQESESESISSGSFNLSQEDEFACHVKEKNVTCATAKTDMLTLRLPKKPIQECKNIDNGRSIEFVSWSENGIDGCIYLRGRS